MHRSYATLLVALASLTAGAGAVHVSSVPVPPSSPPPAAVAVEPPHQVATLPVQQRLFTELLAASAIAAEPGPAPSRCDIFRKIRENDSELASASLSVGTSEYRYLETRGGRDYPRKDFVKDVALRILDPETCTTQVITVTKAYDRVSGRPVAALRVPSGWRIDVVRRENGIEWNNWATEFHISEPAGRIVIGLKYPLIKGEGATREVIEVLYTPYSKELHLPELVRAGQNYLLTVATRAREILRERKVLSRALAGTAVADTPPSQPTWIAALGPNEHMDPEEFILDSRWTAERVFIAIGMNQEHFATYTCSKANACGLMQVTDRALRNRKTGKLAPGTYTRLRRMYPDARLDPDFVTGAQDPLNAMMMAYLHHDDILTQLVGAFGPDIIHDSHLRQYLAAGYNGGGEPVIASIRKQRAKKTADWVRALPTCLRKGQKNCMPVETQLYVGKDLSLSEQWPDEALAVSAPSR